MSGRFSAIVLIAFALAACANSRVDLIAPEGWLEIRSENFVVIGNAQHDELRRLATELQVFDALVDKVTNAPAGDAPPPVRLYVFESEDDARRFTGPAAGILVPTLPGYFAILSTEGSGFRFSTRQILFHEYVHAVLRRNRRVAYPRWYDEGFCEFLGSAHFRDDVIIIGAAPAGRLDSIARFDFMPLVHLFSEDETSQKETYRFYASSWALVHYLNTSGGSSARLARYVSRLVRGEPWRGAFAASFDESLMSLQAAVENHVVELQRGARFDSYLRVDSLPISREREEKPISAAEISYQLGTHARAMGELTKDRADSELAKKLFRQALGRDPSHTRARAAAGWSQARRGDWEAAESTIRQATEEAPDDPVVMLEAGRVYALRASAGEGGESATQSARATLGRAVELAPDDPEAHKELAHFYHSTGEAPERVIAELERARELGEWSPGLDVDLATQLLNTGDRKRAETLLVAVAADVHGGDPADEARRLLKSLRNPESHE